MRTPELSLGPRMRSLLDHIADGATRADARTVRWAGQLEDTLLSSAHEAMGRALSGLPQSSGTLAGIFESLGERSGEAKSHETSVMVASVSAAAYRTAGLLRQVETGSAERAEILLERLFGRPRVPGPSQEELLRGIGKLGALLVHKGIDAPPVAHDIRARIIQIRTGIRARRRRERHRIK